MWISDPSLMPPSGWKYEDGDTHIEGPDYRSLLERVARHREANKLPIEPTEELVNTYLCQQNPPNFCVTFRGAGDIAHMILQPLAKAVGRQGCAGCLQRQAQLNRAIPL